MHLKLHERNKIFYFTPKRTERKMENGWGNSLCYLESIQCKNFLEGCYVKVSTSNIQERRFLIPYG